MELAEIKNDIQNMIGKLSPDKLEIALEFLKELQETGEEETRLLLSRHQTVSRGTERQLPNKSGRYPDYLFC